MNLLFLNVGRRCELVESFREALQARGGGAIYGSDIDPLAPGLQVVDYATIFPRGDSEAFADVLIEFCKAHSICLVIPTIDPDLFRLDKLRERFESEVPLCRLLLSPQFTLQHARDKRLSKKLFAEIGLNVPEAVDTGVDSELEFPLFVKPCGGSAGVGACVVNDLATLRSRLQEDPDLIVERVVQGPEITVDVLCDFSGKALFAVPRKRIKVRSGEVVQGVVERDPHVEQLAMQAAEGFRAVGPVTVQFRQTSEERFVAMEVNARMGGGLPLAIAAGADWPGWILDLCQERVPRTSVSVSDGIMMTRCDRSFFVKPEQRLDLLPQIPLPRQPDALEDHIGKLKAWVFDLDDTLYPERDFVFSGYRAVAEQVFADHGIEIEGCLRDRFNRGERGDLFSKVLVQHGIAFDEPYVKTLVAVYREHHPKVLPYVDVVPLLEKLRGIGVRLGLVSDGWLSVQRKKFEALGLERYFDCVVFTDEINGTGSWKPAADGFDRCLRTLQVPPAEAVYIGDNPGKDFIGARAAGMKTIRVHRVGSEHGLKRAQGPDYEPDWSLRSLASICGMLDAKSGTARKAAQ